MCFFTSFPVLTVYLRSFLMLQNDFPCFMQDTLNITMHVKQMTAHLDLGLLSFWCYKTCIVYASRTSYMLLYVSNLQKFCIILQIKTGTDIPVMRWWN